MSERRHFLKAAGAGLMVLKPETAFSYQANSTVEVGLVGCGGRGNWIGPFFPEFAGARMVALAGVQLDYPWPRPANKDVGQAATPAAGPQAGPQNHTITPIPQGAPR